MLHALRYELSWGGTEVYEEASGYVPRLRGCDLQILWVYLSMKPWDLPSDVDERLWEWAFFFRDRKKLETCRSIEKRYRATSEDFAAEGWGDTETAPSVRPARNLVLLRALETHEVIQGLDRKYKWALTYGYCYPSLPRYLTLRLMKKYTGRYLTWKTYLETMDIARMRVYSLLLDSAAVQPYLSRSHAEC